MYKNYNYVEDDFTTVINSVAHKLKYISNEERFELYNYIVFVTRLKIGKHLIYVLEAKLKENEKLERQVFLDAFTGLFSREFWEHLVDNKFNFSNLCIINLSNLKEINNKFGYHTGDKIIKEFARLVRQELNEDIAIRYSGIDFIILTNQNENGLKNYFKKIFEIIAKKFEINVDYF